MKINKNIYQLFFSIIAGLGLGLVLTYAFNASASGLSSVLTVDGGGAFNAINTADKQVMISGTSGNIGVGIGAVEPTSKIQVSSNGISGIKVNTSGATSDTASGSLGVASGGDAGWGVTGYSSNSNGSGVWGYGNGSNVGVLGTTNYGGEGNGIGVYGISGVGIGVKGQSGGTLSDTTSYDFYGSGPKTYFAGNIGIGTANPLSKLSIGSQGIASVALSVNGPIQIRGQQSDYAKPVCNINTTGTIWVDDLATGYEFQVCLRVGNGVYSWKNIAVN